jgi:hypothetical protein
MIHQASWKALFNLLTMVGESSKWNISGYTGVMDFEANSDVKMVRLNQDYGFLLAANYTKEITILHNPNNFGGNLLHPKTRWDALLESAP